MSLPKMGAFSVNGLCALGAVTLLAATSRAGTVAWWHFDEADPGTTATSGVVAESVSGTTATSYWIESNSVKQTNSPYRPAFGPAFTGLAVYDPVAGTTNANRAAMRFAIARGGATPNANAGRAYYGGALKVDKDTLYPGCTGAVTIESFVCTTGGVYNTFAPIIGCLAGTSWTSEKWAIYMENGGTLAVRFNGSVWYSGNSNAGTARINDGRWHHVAITWNGSTIKVYVDYNMDKNSDNTDRTYSKSGTIDYSGIATWIGGYATYDGSNGGRKFPGLIDEVRVSSGALTPDKFLRLVPTAEECEREGTVLHLRFDNDTSRAFEDSEAFEGAIGGAQAVFYAVSDADASTYDTTEKVADAVANDLYDDALVADTSSFCQFTNAADKANYVKVPAVADNLFTDGTKSTTNLNYTIEAFFKARGEGQKRKTLFKFGSDFMPAHVITGDSGSEHQVQFCYRKDTAHTWVGSGYSPFDKPYDDGNWHHIAFVSDASNSIIRTYYDYQAVSVDRNVYVPVAKGYSLFVGSKEQGGGQFFDGWIDDVRVTKRALSPEEFLTTHPVGTATPNSLFFAGFENNYNFTCASNGYWSVTGSGLKNTSAGNLPTFEKVSPGDLFLDGTNGSERVVNDYSIRLDKSYVEMPVSPLYEQRAFTVEFWAKFTGFASDDGEYGKDDSLPYHAGILRFNRDSGSTFEWFFYRVSGNAKGTQIAVRNAAGGVVYLGVFNFGRYIADGKWHHYAITFDTNEANTLTTVKVYDDYKQVGTTQTCAGIYSYAGGHKLQLGLGSSNPPFTLGYINSLRFAPGVLTPDKFLGRERSGTLMIVR